MVARLCTTAEISEVVGLNRHALEVQVIRLEV